MNVKSKNSGFSLIELILVCSLISILFVSSLTYLPKLTDLFQLKMITIELYEMLSTARFWAQTLDEDIEINTFGHQLIIWAPQSEQIIHDKTIPESFAVSLNRTIGYKSSGTTKQSGTLSIRSVYDMKQITLGVGYGKLTIK